MVDHRGITAFAHRGFGYEASHPPSMFSSPSSLEWESPVKKRCRTGRPTIAAPDFGVVSRCEVGA
jgi:hypothetical protein